MVNALVSPGGWARDQIGGITNIRPVVHSTGSNVSVLLSQPLRRPANIFVIRLLH